MLLTIITTNCKLNGPHGISTMKKDSK